MFFVILKGFLIFSFQVVNNLPASPSVDENGPLSAQGVLWMKRLFDLLSKTQGVFNFDNDSGGKLLNKESLVASTSDLSLLGFIIEIF